MHHNSGKGKDIPDSDFEDCKYKYYEELKEGDIKIKVSDSTYRCPFCVGMKKRDYLFEELLDHASRVGTDSRCTSLKEKARHLALEKYMKRVVHSEPHSKHEKHHSQDRQRHHGDQFFVYPWMGVIANIPREVKDGRYVGESGTKLKEELMSKGFKPQRVHPLWNHRGFSGLAIVEFVKEWDGLQDAIKFERSFEVEHHGRRNYYTSRNVGEKLYGWVAREDDYYSRCLVGEYLRKNGDLKTVSGKEEEDRRRAFKLVRNLTDTLKTKKSSLREIENKCMETVISLETLMDQRDKMIKTYNEEKRRMQQDAHDHFKRISVDHESITLELMNQRNELLQREKELLERESQNVTERRKLQHEKEMNERATAEQEKASDNVLKLAEEQKKEKEELHKKTIALEKRLDDKQALELEIERMKGALEVMKHMAEEDDMEIKKKMDEMQEELEDKKEELEYWESTNQTLVIKEQKTNEELGDARLELINGLKKSAGRAFIGVKKMGEDGGSRFQTKKVKRNSMNAVDEKDLELWNFKEERPATLIEGLAHILKQFRQHKRKRH